MVRNYLNTNLFKTAMLMSIVIGTRASWYHETEQDGNYGNIQMLKSTQKIQQWPSATVFFEIAHDFNSSSRLIIKQAMEEISHRTCIKFVPRDHTNNDYVFIQLKPDLGCRTQIGKRGGRQFLTLNGDRCLQHGRILHELMHTLGLEHEHQRRDRNKYIKIFWNNIKQDDIPQFKILKTSLSYTMGFPYDYGSITHYANVSPTASIDINKPIILPKKPTNVMGQRLRLSQIDVLKINMLYRCSLDVRS